MQKLVYVPPGGDYDDSQKRVILTAEEPFVLSSVKGLGGPEAEIISTEIVSASGEYYRGCRYTPRNIPCSVYVKGRDRADMYRQRTKLIGILRPEDQPGTLYYENDYISVKVAAIPRVPPDFTDRIKNYSRSDVAFYCPVPEWISLEEQEKSMAYIEGSEFTFPCTFDPSISFVHTVNTLDIEYNGTAPAPVKITVLGPSESPVIRNLTTNKSIGILRPLSVNEILVINTERGKKSVKLINSDTDSETDAFGYINPTSEFWELVPGVNRITYGDQEQISTSIYINFQERYAGV